jgi:hypothetical protein
MVNGERPVWDVDGYIAVVNGSGSSGTPGASGHFGFHLRCQPSGACAVDIDGVTLPVPATMRAADYFDLVFGHAFGEPPTERVIDTGD